MVVDVFSRQNRASRWATDWGGHERVREESSFVNDHTLQLLHWCEPPKCHVLVVGKQEDDVWPRYVGVDWRRHRFHCSQHNCSQESKRQHRGQEIHSNTLYSLVRL